MLYITVATAGHYPGGQLSRRGEPVQPPHIATITRHNITIPQVRHQQHAFSKRFDHGFFVTGARPDTRYLFPKFKQRRTLRD
ncbi:MAG: hypothetical protein ACRDQJ_17460 [Pseudonocardiaceae bacterium]